MSLRAFGRWAMHSPVPMVLARLVVGGVYLWYGVNKIADPVAFLKALREYDVLPLSPPQILNLVVVVLPWIEVVCGALLLVGAWLRAAGVLLFTMTGAFTIAVTLRAFAEAGRQGLGLCEVRFDCGCGVGEVLFCLKAIENLGLIVLSVVIIVSRSRHLAIEGSRRASVRSHPG